MAETSFIIDNGRRVNLKDAIARKAINELNQKVENGIGGEKGEPGNDGVSCTHNWNGTVLTVTSASGTSSADLKGDTGAPGNDGADGYTPQKGIDYFDGAPGVAGKDGYTPIKGVDYFDGVDGSPGADGKDGVSVTHSWNGTVLTVTSASGTSSVDLKGDPGADGEMTFEELTAEQKASLKGDKGDTGPAGAAATINGVNALTIEGGDNIVLAQSGSTLTINASGGGSGGVHIGSSEPTDENAIIWVDTSGEAYDIDARIDAKTKAITVAKIREICI